MLSHVEPAGQAKLVNRNEVSEMAIRIEHFEFSSIGRILNNDVGSPISRFKRNICNKG